MKNNLLKGTLIVTVSSLFVKVLSIVYKIPYQNIMGDMGFYIFQQLYPLFALLIAYATFALPLALSEQKKSTSFPQTVKSSLLFHIVFSLIFGLVIFMLRDELARVYGDKRLNVLFIAYSISLCIAPVLGVVRGILNSNMMTLKYVGYSIVIEQITRVSLILVILYLFATEVITDNYINAMYSYLAFSVGMIIAIIYSIYKLKLNRVWSKQTIKFNYKLVVPVLKRSLFLLTTSSILILLYFIDSVTIVNILVNNMSLTDAMIIKGVYDRSLPLIQASLFFVSPILSSYLPHIQSMKQRIIYGKLINIILMLSLPATIGSIMVLGDINQLLFQDQSLNPLLKVSLIMICLYALVLTFTSIIANQKSMIGIIIGSLVIKYGMNSVLIAKFGIIGAPIASIISLAFILILIIIINYKYIHFYCKETIYIILSSLGMSGILYLVSDVFDIKNLFIKIIIGLTSYTVLSVVFGVINLTNLKNSFSDKELVDRKK